MLKPQIGDQVVVEYRTSITRPKIEQANYGPAARTEFTVVGLMSSDIHGNPQVKVSSGDNWAVQKRSDNRWHAIPTYNKKFE